MTVYLLSATGLEAVSLSSPSTASPSTAPPSTAATFGGLDGQQGSHVPGPQQDQTDFFGLLGAIVLILAAILAVRLFFRRPRHAPSGVARPGTQATPAVGPRPDAQRPDGEPERRSGDEASSGPRP